MEKHEKRPCLELCGEGKRSVAHSPRWRARGFLSSRREGIAKRRAGARRESGVEARSAGRESEVRFANSIKDGS